MKDILISIDVKKMKKIVLVCLTAITIFVAVFAFIAVKNTKAAETPAPAPADAIKEYRVVYAAPETVKPADETVVFEVTYTENDLIALTKMLWGEARGCDATDKRFCCITACNRADDSRFPNTVAECVTQYGQYIGYCETNPVDDDLKAIAKQVLIEWELQKQGVAIAWEDYNSFWGDGVQNHFYTI